MQTDPSLSLFLKHSSIPPEKALIYYIEGHWEIGELKSYLATFNYSEDVLHESLVKTILAICQSENLNTLHNFIFHIYRQQYDLSEFSPLTIFRIEPREVLSVVNSYSKKFSGGIGDFLRGSMYLYEALKHTQAKFYVSFQNHPLGKFIKTSCNIKHEHDRIIDLEAESYLRKNDLPWSVNLNQTLASLINECIDNHLFVSSFFSDMLLVPNYSSNAKVYQKHFKASEDCINFFRKNIKFDTSVEDYFDNLNITDYEVIHFRLGDMQILSNLKKEINNYDESIQTNPNYRTFDHKYNKYYDKIKSHLMSSKCKNIIVMSDCNKFKSYILDNNQDPRIHVLHTNSCHTSYAPSTLALTNFQNIDIEEQKLFYTALDVKILSKSQQNTSYSVYDWGSGFVYWISQIAGVSFVCGEIFKDHD